MDGFFATIGWGNFIIVLGVLIFVHEMGHYLVARWCGVRVEVFSIGFGREIFGWTDRSGTRWKVSLLPLGGYVKMFGEGNASVEEEQRENKSLTEQERSVSFAHKNVYQRSAVVAAGPIANFLFAFLVYAAAAYSLGFQKAESLETHGIGEVVANSAAEKAGMQKGDRIVAIDGKPLQDFSGLVEAVRGSEGRALSFLINRDGVELTLFAAPEIKSRINVETGKEEPLYTLGVNRPISQVDVGLGEAIVHGVTRTYEISVHILVSVGQLISGQGNLDEIGGPVKIAEVSSDVGKMGALSVLALMAALSVNLGLLNLFPIPMLDGGHLLFYFFEMVLGKPVNAKIQEIGLRVGVSLLLTLMIFFTINDLINLGKRTFGID
ncbi:RIP metalloprotease RseP [Aestuariispira insulae]|uniref:Zinc metalloprotease n=1 Tax=Aestuariispira insulae TaxID=1461337 RepID=A0A3D9HV56_9PROT|nr:RIP metalloprotease RseP [Aestuariispira insulae]RED53295.1 regulator of sigma E protease [Aestuariispira insulae]